MERKPLLSLQLTDLNPRRGSESRPVSQMATDCFDFEFPTVISSFPSPNDVVFCGKVISRETQPRGKYKSPFQLRSESFSSVQSDRIVGSDWWRRSDGHSRSRKHRNGLFGMVKFPIQMDLSDMKMRQERRKPLRPPMPKSVAEDDGVESCWDMVRPLKGRSWLMNALAKAKFECIPIV